MRTLLMMRHARTEDARHGARDHERRLTDDGRRDAEAVGDHLRALGTAPDLVVCSSALRAQQTVAALRTQAPVVVTERLYDAGGDDVVAVVRDLADDVGCVLLVGHAPGLPAAVHDLADPGTSDAAALAEIAWRFPAGALVTMTADLPWSDLDAAALVAVRLP